MISVIFVSAFFLFKIVLCNIYTERRMSSAIAIKTLEATAS